MPRVALVVPRPIAEVNASLGALGLAVRVEKDVLDLSTADLVVADYDALNQGQRAALRHHRATPPVVYLSTGCKEDFAQLFSKRQLANLLGRNGGGEAEDFQITVRKLLGERLLGLEPYLGAGCTLRHAVVTTSRARDALVGEAHRFASARGILKRLADAFAEATDELLTNALYDAPRKPDGEPRCHDRTRVVELEPGEEVEVTFGATPSRLGVAVKDPFGTLARDHVLDYLGKCFARGDDQIDSKKGGAGLGLYTVFERVSHFVLNLSPGRSTEALGLIDLGHSYRHFAGKAKSFNVFVS